MSYPIPDSEAAHLPWLEKSRLLDAPRDFYFDEITQFATKLFVVPIAAISLFDGKRQWFKSVVGLDVSGAARDLSFFTHAVAQAGVLVVPDATQDARFAENPLVTGEVGIRFYADAPLVTSDSVLLGSLCIIDYFPRDLSEEKQSLLKMLAHQISTRLELYRRIADQERLAAERAVMERRLAESKQKYRSLFEYNSNAVFTLDLEGYFISANAASETLAGFAEAGVIGKHFKTLVSDVEKASAGEKFVEVTGGRTVTFETVLTQRGGAEICVLVTASPLVVDGKVVGALGIVKDITERVRLQEQRARELTEAKERADRDPLTGLLNHRAFYKRLQEETDRARRTGTSVAVAMIDLDNFKFFNEVYGHATGDGVLCQLARRLKEVCRSYDIVSRFGGDEFALLLPEVSSRLEEYADVYPNPGSDPAAAICARLHKDMMGLTFQPSDRSSSIPLTISIGLALFPQDGGGGGGGVGGDRLNVVRAASENLRRVKSGISTEYKAEKVRAMARSKIASFTMLESLVIAVDTKDRYTRHHSEDVMTHSLAIAQRLGMSEDEQEVIAVAALLHDVGKIGVPDFILRKPGALTGDEFDAIRQHPQIGAVIVAAVAGLESALDSVRHHHERWDGAGYPDRLRGEQIPLHARIMAVADAYSALTMDRPYRQGRSHDAALAVLKDGSGSQWDAQCIEAFCGAFGNRRGNEASELGVGSSTHVA